MASTARGCLRIILARLAPDAVGTLWEHGAMVLSQIKRLRSGGDKDSTGSRKRWLQDEVAGTLTKHLAKQ